VSPTGVFGPNLVTVGNSTRERRELLDAGFIDIGSSMRVAPVAVVLAAAVGVAGCGSQPVRGEGVRSAADRSTVTRSATVATPMSTTPPTTTSPPEPVYTPPLYTPPQVPEYTPPAPVMITYKVYGAKRASVTYSTRNFSQQQDTSASLPWSRKVEDVKYPVLVAQNAAGGSITCEILHDGESVSKNTSTGDYAVVTCS
jgi:hypothetical protein